MIEITKKCSKCLKEKDISLFNKAKTGIYGVRGDCRECQKKYNNNYVIDNKDELKLKGKINNIKYKDYYSDYRKNNADKRRDYINNRMKTDYMFKLTNNIKKSIGSSFKRNNVQKNSKSCIILGCSIEEFRIYLESKFEPWMNWDNYGNWNGTPNELNTAWDIDHIIPTSSATTEEELIKLNHYSNLQPLCSYTNRFIKKNQF